MNPAVRGPAPELVERYGAEIGREYAERRRLDRSYRFQWPRREGHALYTVVREALRPMTDERCAYCDGHPIDATSTESVDHFRPKGNPAFYELVCTWSNLYLVCHACNHAKHEAWDDDLLCPDAPGYTFEHYFQYRFDSGELHPNPGASPTDQRKATRTIEIFELNRTGACKARQRTVRFIQQLRTQSAPSSHDLGDLAYRYLIALCSQ